MTYLDYTGATLYPESLVTRDAARLTNSVLGNPHSQSAPALAATEGVEAARAAILAFLNADPAEYTVVLTANASAACRLVGESFPFAEGSVFALARDNHNSVIGIREYAVARGASVKLLPLDKEFRLEDPVAALGPAPKAPSLLAFPAQSNFTGVKHSLALIEHARRSGWRTFLDAAAYLPTSDLDLRVVRPDFICLSLYKIAGYPTGVGALVARRDALAELQRPAFAGGTVQWVSVAHQRHRLTSGAEGFEDGTPAFLAIGAVADALEAARAVDRPRLGRHLRALTTQLLDGLKAARHANGAPRVRIHGPADVRDRGATVAFTVFDDAGKAVPYWVVEEKARLAGIAIRGGCFCNPGCSEHAFDFESGPMIPCLDELGADFTVPAFAECMGGRPVGAVRISMGCGSLERDVVRVLEFMTTGA
jgi:selenocysteine lyase/cysteine desulfurase